MAQSHKKYRQHNRLHLAAHRKGARIRRPGRKRLFRRFELPRIRLPFKPLGRGHARRRARRKRRGEEEPRRLRAVEGCEGGRDFLGFALGQGQAGLAYRVLRHEPRRIRRPDRYPRRRQGFDFPPPRKRDCAERVFNGQTLCKILDAQRADKGQRAEDVEVSRQLPAPQRPPQKVHQRGDKVCALADQLPQ